MVEKDPFRGWERSLPYSSNDSRILEITLFMKFYLIRIYHRFKLRDFI